MSFLAPLGALLGLLAVPLVALYFLKIRRRRVKVPSTLLWREFARTERLASPFQRFRRNLLLLLQLLILLLVVLAFMRPFLQADIAVDRSVVLLVDTSASMGATDEEPTRLARAVREARDLVAGLGPGDEAMLVVVGAETGVKVSFTRDTEALDAALAALTPTEAEGSLREGVALALSLVQSRPGVEIVVLSDGGNEDLSDVAVGQRQASVRYVRIGSKDANAAILALDIRSSPSNDLERSLFLTVQSFGHAPVDGTVEVFLDDKLVGLRTQELKPDEPASYVFDLPAGMHGELQARLRVQGDLLPADDQAWAVVDEAAQRRVLVVGGDRLTLRVLEADPRVKVQRVAAEGFTPDLLDGADCTLFTVPVPPGLDGVSYGVLAPVEGGPVRFGATVDRPKVLGWRRTHPVLRFVSWDGVLVTEAKRIDDPGGLVPLVDTDIGPLLLAGERQGGRVVQLAFEPLKSDLPLRVAWPVLLMNTVGWLTESATTGTASRIIPAGAPYVRRVASGVDAASVSVTGPGGVPVKSQVVDDQLRVQDTGRVGVYRVRAGNVRTAFAANLHSPAESRIEPRATLDLGESGTAIAQASVAGRRELWRPLVLLGLFVIVLEWLVWTRRRS